MISKKCTPHSRSRLFKSRMSLLSNYNTYIGKRIEMRNTHEKDKRRRRRNETLRTANRTDAGVNYKARRGCRKDAT